MRVRVEKLVLWLAAHIPHVPRHKRGLHYLCGVVLGVAMLYCGACVGEAKDEELAGMGVLSVVPLVGGHAKHIVGVVIEGFGLIPLIAHGDKLFKHWMEPEVVQPGKKRKRGKARRGL